MNELFRLTIAAVVAAVLSALYFMPHDKPANNSHMATEAPSVAKVDKVAVTPVKVWVYDSSAKGKLPLPDTIKNNPDEHVLTASKVEGHTVITAINTTTGEATTVDNKDPLPWVAAVQLNEVKLEYGLSGVGRLSYRRDIFQIKAANFGVSATLDSDGSYFIGAGIAYRF